MFSHTWAQKPILPCKVTKNFSFPLNQSKHFCTFLIIFSLVYTKKGKDMKTNMSPAKKTPPFPT